MIKYFTEAEDTNLDPMDVQVGPQEEIEANAEKIECDPGAEAACAAKNPVEEAKKDPNTIPVAGITKSGVQEFYVDAADIEKYAELHEKTMLEGLNDLIACHEEAGMSAGNIVVVMSEGTEGYIHNLEKHGAACVSFVNEADDVTVDVQVGPEGEEVTVKEDPQEANPVDAVKRQYDSVVVAKDDDKFFMDVEDVQKCAEINHESVIETLNNIIGVNEEFDMNPENIVLLVNENTSEEMINTLSEAGVLMEANFTFLPKLSRDPSMKQYVGDLKEAEKLCNEKNIETKAGAMKACRIAARILDIYYKVGSVITLPAVLSIIGIIPYLMIRGLEWLSANGEESAAKAEGKKIMAALKKAIEKEENEEAKAKLQAAYDKVEKSMKKVNSAFEDI